MYKSLQYGLVIALTCTLCTCGDDNKDDEKKPESDVPEQTKECTENAQKCDGDYVMMCVKGVWETNSKPCANGCLAGSCMAVDGECEEDELRCHGDVIQFCVNNAWKEVEKCTNGCNEVAKKCNAASDIPTPQDPPATKCEENEQKCQADDVLVCHDNIWTKTESCPYGCDSGKCIEKTDNPPDSDSYCLGETLHEWINGKEFTSTCKYKGLECQLLKDGTSACVLNDESVKTACQQDKQILNANCIASDAIGDVNYPFIGMRMCTLNSKGSLVIINNNVLSVCGTYNNESVALMCHSDTSTQLLYHCKNCTNNDFTAFCDEIRYIPSQIDNPVDANLKDLSLSESSYSYCGDKADGIANGDANCSAKNLVGICYSDILKDCYEPCTVKDSFRTTCYETATKGKYKYEVQKCVQVDKKLVYITKKYATCNNACNASNTACK